METGQKQEYMILTSPDALQHMFSDKNDNDTQPSSGPKPRKTRKLRWQRSKMRNIKAKLDETYLNRLTEKKLRVSATVPCGERSSTRPCPTNGPSRVVRKERP